MSNYSKSTNFATKDSLASGNPLKVIKGTEIDDEFEAIETAIGTKADLASPTLTGTPTAPTASAATMSCMCLIIPIADRPLREVFIRAFPPILNLVSM